MSESEESSSEGVGRETLSRLEAVVGRLLEEHAVALERAERAEGRVQDLEALLRSFGKGDARSSDMQTELLGLKQRNRKLRGRIEQGREGVERLLARLRFLEDQA